MTLTRAISALIGIPILVYLVKFAPVEIFVAVTLVATFLMLYEYFALTKDHSSQVITLPAYVLATAILLSFYFQTSFLGILLPAGAMLVLLTALFARVEMSRALHSTAFSVFGAWYVAGLMGFLIAIRMIDQGGETGADLTMMLFVMIWAADIFAFIFGKAMGRHKLTIVSPKKTVEGAVAAFLFSIAAALLYGYFFTPQFSWQHVAAMGALVGITGQLGDLCESLLKRSASVKDSGSVIPGHGGMLDRLDSLLFGAPTMYYYYYFVLQK